MKSVEPGLVIGVIGAGTMGQGIAQTCAATGYRVKLYDVNSTLVTAAKASIEKNFVSQVAKGKLDSAVAQQYFANIESVNSLNDVVADLIVEAIVERLQVKQELFSTLEKVNSIDTILTSNTSSLSISEIGKGIVGQDRFAGMHFFNPAPLMKLVEVIKGTATSNDTVDFLYQFCFSLKKQPVLVKDSPGFIVNRVARLFYLEAMRLVEEGAADFATIDSLARNSGFKMGPFELMDLIGVDTNFAVTKSIYESFNRNEKFKPSSIQEEKVKAGHYGRKTGKGFYDYTN